MIVHTAPDNGNRNFRGCGMRGIFSLPGCALFVALLVHGASPQAIAVDAAIVFAVDVSSSISPDLADLQRDGHADAIRSPEVVAAIESQPNGCIAVLYLEWSGLQNKKVLLPWTLICNASDAGNVADAIALKGHRGSGRNVRGRTSVSSAIDTAHLYLDRLSEQADRKIIDLSTNGTNNDGRPVSVSRGLAIDAGLTINAILLKSSTEDPEELFDYYNRNVIGGPSSFITTAVAPADYARGLRQKLLTEMSAPIANATYMMAQSALTP